MSDTCLTHGVAVHCLAMLATVHDAWSDDLLQNTDTMVVHRPLRMH